MATIKTPAAGVSPYQDTATLPNVLRAGANGSTVLANPTATATAAANANTNVIVNGNEALNSLIATSRSGVFEGANVTINLEEQNFNTTNQVTSNTNYPAGNIGEIQFNSGSNSFASNAYFTYDNSNVITPGIRTDGYFYSNGAPFIGGGNAAIGNFVFTGDTMTISDDANISLTIQGNSLGNNLNQIIINPTSVDLYAFNNNPYSYSELYLDNGNTEAPYAQIIIDGNSTPQQTWTFDALGNLTLPGLDNAQLIVNPTGGPGLWTPGGTAAPSLNYGVSSNVSVADNIVLTTDSGNSIWIFGADGGTIFPTLTTQRGDNPSGTITGQTLLFGNSQQEAIISTPDGYDGEVYSQRLVINPGQGYDYGEGGDIYLWAGRGGNGSGSGGDIKIRGGQGGANTVGGAGGDGGYIRMEAGDAASTGGNPGFIEITGGYSNTQGGYVSVTGGVGATVGGDVKIYGGYGQATGGNVNIWGGGSGNGQSNEGHVNIETGGNTWTFDATGAISLPNPLTDARSQIYTTNGGYQTVFETFSTGDGQGAGQKLTLDLDDAAVKIQSQAGTEWKFDQYGNLILPGNTSSINYANGQPYGGSGGSITLVPNDVTYQTGSLYGNANTGFTVVTTQDDDASYNVPIDFPIEFLGNAYSNGNVYLVSNSYLTFGSGLFENYIPVGPGVVSVPAIFVGATDLSNQKYYYGYADGTDVYVIGYEGSTGTYGETGYSNITWEMQVNSATPDQINIVTNLTAQQPGGVWGVSNGAEWVDQFQPLPWFSNYADSTFNSVLIAPVTPQAATNIAFTGPGVTIGQDSGTTYVNIDPFDSIISVGTGGEGGSARLSSVYEDFILTTPTRNAAIYMVPQGAAVITAGSATNNQPGNGSDVAITAGNAHDNPNSPGQNYGGGNITLLTGSAVGNSRPGQISFGVGNYLWFFDPTGGTRFPNLTVERGDNPSGTIQGQTLLFSDPTVEAIITTPNGPNVTFPNSQRLVINPGAGAANTAGEGGDIYLWAGRGGDASGSGGDIKIRGGQGGDNSAGGTGGAGGYIRIEAGDAPAVGGASGFIEMTAGAGGENQTGGYVRILGGTGSDGNYPGLQGGGDANIQGGYGRVNAPGGNVNLVGGISANGLADYGRVNISSGASTWVFDNQGNLTTPGSSGNITGANVISANVYTAPGNVTLTAGSYSWIFEDNGNLTFPTGMHIDNEGANTRISQNEGQLKITAGTSNASLKVGWSESEGTGTGNVAQMIANGTGQGSPGNVTIFTGNQSSTTYSWTFDNSGNATFPGNLALTGNLTGVGASPAPSINGFDTINSITVSASGNITGAYFFGNGSQLTDVGAATVPGQNILPTIQTITIAAAGTISGQGNGYANVIVANVTPVTEYGVIITAGTINQKYVTGSLGNIPGTEQIQFNTGLGSTPFTVYAYVTSNAGTYYSNSAIGTSGICLLAGTQIALSDGTRKAIEDITYTDKLLSWDFDRGCYAETTALWIKRSETGSQYNLLTFSDGTTLRTFDQHRIFNKQAGAFTYPMTDATPIGTVTVNEHGQEITLTNKQVIQDTIEYYNVITDYHMNLFSDSVLTSCRFNNIYPITDMKFVKDSRTLRTRDEFENVEDRFFHGLRLAEQTADIETVEWYVDRLLATEVSTQSELAF